MTGDVLREEVPGAVLEATRSLLWVETPADAVRIVTALVLGLGGLTSQPGVTPRPAQRCMGYSRRTPPNGLRFSYRSS